MNVVTILTPTYNRASLLPRLYDSLLNQISKDFEWIVVDDGSSDNTKELIAEYKEQGKLDIKYIYQDNAGKHVALNNGIAVAEGKLLFIVDSDDYLPEDAVEIILEYHSRYESNYDICGFSFLRCYEDGSVNTGYYPQDDWVATFLEARINSGLLGDKAEVYYTDILKKYPFPVFDGEKFLPEDAVWMKMSRDYSMVHINKCVYISEYLEGGLTKQGRKKKIESPLGMMYRSQVYLETEGLKTLVKCKMMLLYIIYGGYAGISFREMYKQVKDKVLYVICYVPAIMIRLRWKK